MRNKVLIAILLLLILFCLPACGSPIKPLPAQETFESEKVSADGSYSSREEVIYSTLSSSGEVEQIYAVNILNVTDAGMLTDYGNYSSIKNLTSTEVLSSTNDRVTLNAPSGRFYYQGNMTNKNLPWTIGISYTLDNSTALTDSLVGKSGHLIIHLTTDQNMNIDPIFFQNYLLQVTFTLDTGKCTNIRADGATFANAGTDKLITFTVMPGKAGALTVEADVNDFEMKEIAFSAVPFSLDIDLPDATELTEGLGQLPEATGQLTKGISSLTDGADELAAGMKGVKSGSSDFLSGLNKLDDKSVELVAASEQISAGLSEISAGYQAVSNVLGQSAGALSGVDIPEEDLKELIINNPGNAALTQLLEIYKAARTIKGSFEDPAFAMAITGLSAGITGLADDYSQFHTGLTAYTGGINQAASSYDLLDGAVSDLSAGAGKLAEGLKAMEEGVTELDTEAENIPTLIQSSMENLLSDYDTTGFVPISFTSVKNDKVTSVQFVFRTGNIIKAKTEEVSPDTTKTEGFWTRLKKLFTR